MNDKQRVALLIGLALVLVMGIFPPWRGLVPTTVPPYEQDAGYAFVFAPPKKGLLTNGYEPEFLYREPHIHFSLLATQWCIVGAITALVVLALREHEMRQG
jgi:hypothetical protein